MKSFIIMIIFGLAATFFVGYQSYAEKDPMMDKGMEMMDEGKMDSHPDKAIDSGMDDKMTNGMKSDMNNDMNKNMNNDMMKQEKSGMADPMEDKMTDKSKENTQSEMAPEGEMANTRSDGLAVATFAGGCFWCTESDFEKAEGVKDAVSGYTGGSRANPTYEQVSAGRTGHAEAVQVFYDSSVISYEELLDLFWRHINPTDPGGQFVDRGTQYRSEIFYHDEAQKKAALASRKALEASGVFDKPIVTDITPFTTFYRAEEYHQDYHKKSLFRYKFYRNGSGRDQFLKKTWKGRENVRLIPEEGMESGQMMKGDAMGKWSRPGDGEIREKLTALQYKVTQKDGTEPPFNNQYWNNKKAGIYVDIVSGEPLFSSTDKYDSGTGWPSFTKPLEADHIVEKKDRSLFMTRTEVRSHYGDSHLGHVFPDGPAPTGLRYCINSASLRFIPVESLEKEGYGKYALLF